MKGLLVLLLMLVLASCGDFEWFPEDGTTTTTTPPTTPTQQAFNNNSTATTSGPTIPALPVTNATDKLSVTAFRYYENNRDTANVSIGFDVEVANDNTTETKVEVTIAAKDASQADIPVTTTTATIPAGGRQKWYPTASLSASAYDGIKVWTLVVAKTP